MKSSLKVVLGGLLVINLSGCFFGAIPLAVQGVAAVVDRQKDAYKDVEMTMSRGYTKADIAGIENVSFIVSEGGNNNYFSQGIASIFGDNLAKEFIKQGYDVVDREAIEDIVNEQKFQTGSFSSKKNLAKIGGILGVDGMFKGSVQSGHGINQGFLGIGAEMKNGILSASLKLIDIKTSKTILIVSATYKKPKPASEVASDMAKAFKNYQQNNEEQK